MPDDDWYIIARRQAPRYYMNKTECLVELGTPASRARHKQQRRKLEGVKFALHLQFHPPGGPLLMEQGLCVSFFRRLLIRPRRKQ